MTDMLARCRSCGYEQPETFERCPVCLGPCGWWCGACREWRPDRLCPGCGGMLLVPPEVNLGAFPPGAVVPFRFAVRNPGHRPIEFSVYRSDGCISLPTHRRTLKPGDSAELVGTLTLGPLIPGLRAYKIRFESPIPAETDLVVEVVPAVVRLEFDPAELVVRHAAPGKLLRRELVVRNTGNVPVSAAFAASDPWLSVAPDSLGLPPGGSATLRVAAKTRKSDHGTRVARVVARAEGGKSWEAAVRVRLPEPEVTAEAVDFGEALGGRPAFASVTLRNTGRVRVACALTADRPWLAVTPRRLGLPPGREKVVKLRAVLPEDEAGRHDAAVVVAFDGRELLRVPVAAVCKVPKPVLGTVRRQTPAAVANDAPVVRRFRVTNTGDGRLNCTVTADAPWVEVLTPAVAVGPGKKRRVEFKIDAPNMTPGRSAAVIRLRSNGGDADVPLTLTVVEPNPELEMLGDAELGTVTADGPAAGSLSVRNAGVGLLRLRAEPEDPRVAVTPAELVVAPGPPAKLAVAVDVAGLAGGAHAFGVRFAGNGGTGRAEVRLRLPVEVIDVPTLIELGDRAAGRPVGDALRIRNAGPDPVSLRIVADEAWAKPGTGQVTVRPGELVAVPFRLDLPQGVEGLLVSTIRVEGRTARHAVAVRVTARRVDLVVTPHVLVLGDMTPGEERAFALQIANKGGVPAEVRATHTPGELEVWVRRQALPPGQTVTVAGRVRMNAKGIGRQVRSVVHLADEAHVRFSAKVARPMTPRIVAGVTAAGGVVAGVALGASVGWFFGIAVALAGLVAGAVVIAMTEGQ